MGQPPDRVAAHVASGLRNICPIGIFFQPEEYPQGTLIASLGQDDFVALMECFVSRSGAHDVRMAPLVAISFAAAGYGQNFGLFTTLCLFQLGFRRRFRDIFGFWVT